MKPIVRKAITVILVVIAIYSIWTAFRTALNRITCSATNVEVVNLSSLRFEVEDTRCDGLAKDEAIRVYVNDFELHGGWIFSKWRNKRTLLFDYDPGRWDNPLPSITRPNPSTILISIPEVSSIHYQSRKWADITVNYHIGQVEYPEPSK